VALALSSGNATLWTHHDWTRRENRTSTLFDRRLVIWTFLVATSMNSPANVALATLAVLRIRERDVVVKNPFGPDSLGILKVGIP